MASATTLGSSYVLKQMPQNLVQNQVMCSLQMPAHGCGRGERQTVFLEADSIADLVWVMTHELQKQKTSSIVPCLNDNDPHAVYSGQTAHMTCSGHMGCMTFWDHGPGYHMTFQDPVTCLCMLVCKFACLSIIASLV